MYYLVLDIFSKLGTCEEILFWLGFLLLVLLGKLNFVKVSPDNWSMVKPVSVTEVYTTKISLE